MKYLFIVIFFLSCESKKYHKEFYSNGNLKTRIEVNSDNVKNGLFEEYYDSGELKSHAKYLNGNIIDTVTVFYKNGNIKEKGLIGDNGLKFNWWFYFDHKGSLNKKIQYKLFNDTIYKNQIIIYNKNIINENMSSYFLIDLPDTIKLGKSLGQISHYSSNYKADYNLISVVVENEYSETVMKRDTFSDGTLNPKFGINTYKTGEQKIKGFIIEEILNRDSTSLMIRKHKKYFEKEVFVKK